MLKDLFKTHQVQKLNQCQKPTKWAKPLGTSAIWRGSLDFSGLRTIITTSFTVTLFGGMVFSLFNHLGYLLFLVYFVRNVSITGIPGGFIILGLLPCKIQVLV